MITAESALVLRPVGGVLIIVMALPLLRLS